MVTNILEAFAELALIRFTGQIEQYTKLCQGEIMPEGKRVVRQYPLEFKVDAVKLLEEGYTVSEAAKVSRYPKPTSPSGVPRALPSS